MGPCRRAWSRFTAAPGPEGTPGFYCREAVEAYEEFNDRFVISARKTSRLVEQLRQAEWKPSKKTDAGWECEFLYQPDGWKKPYRFVALRYEKTREEREEETEQYQLFETSQYKYRAFVTDFSEPIDFTSAMRPCGLRHEGGSAVNHLGTSQILR